MLGALCVACSPAPSGGGPIVDFPADVPDPVVPAADAGAEVPGTNDGDGDSSGGHEFPGAQPGDGGVSVEPDGGIDDASVHDGSLGDGSLGDGSLDNRWLGAGEDVGA